MFKSAAHLPGDLNRLTRETGMLLATVDSLTDDELAAPSKCEGWTRAHVVAHLALGADAMGNMLTWARPAWRHRPTCPGTPATLTSRIWPRSRPQRSRRAAHRCQELCRQGGDLEERARGGDRPDPGGADITPYAVPALRISEVIIHHADLDTVWELEEADRRSRGHPGGRRRSGFGQGGLPRVTIDTDEREHYVIGDGATAIEGGRDAVIGWLARGRPTASGTTASCPRDRPVVG